MIDVKNLKIKVIDFKPGDRIGKLTIIKQDFSSIYSHVHKGKTKRNYRKNYKYLCDCGREGRTTGQKLRRYLKIGKISQCAPCAYRSRPQSIQRFPIEKKLYHNIISRCKGTKIKNKINLDIFIEYIKRDCFYCGAKPKKKTYLINNKYAKSEYIYANGLDRVDSKGDYEIGNIVACCKKCNIAKNVLTQSEFYSHIKKIYEYLKLGKNNE